MNPWNAFWLREYTSGLGKGRRRAEVAGDCLSCAAHCSKKQPSRRHRTMGTLRAVEDSEEARAWARQLACPRTAIFDVPVSDTDDL